ncbi:APC family permease [Mycoplasma sp. 4423]
MKKIKGKNFLFYGINYIVGFGLLASIASVLKTGSYSILVFAITSFIAGGVMLAFARGTQMYSKEVGGSYVFVKKAFPKKRWLWYFNGWNQFLQAPLFSATTPLFFISIIRLFINNSSVYEKYSLLIQLLALLFFIVLTIISALNFGISKKVIVWTAYIKWIVIAIIFASVIALLIQNPGNSFIKNTEKVTPFMIISSILSFIYAYGGVEGLSGLSTEVEAKNFRKILLSVFGIILFIYLVFYLMFIFIDSSSVSTKTISNYTAAIMNKVMGIAGLIIFTIGLLFRQVTSTVFSMIYYAKAVVPLAQDGFLPSQLSQVAKNGQHRKAIVFAASITIASMIIFTILPGLLGVPDQFETILNAGNLVFFVQYLLAIIAVLVLSKKLRNEVKFPLWEKIVYIITSILIIIVLLITFIPPIVGEAYDSSQLITILSYIVFMVIGFIVWGVYLLFKWFIDFKKAIINPQNQSQNLSSKEYTQLLKQNSDHTHNCEIEHPNTN